jgi:hypothetical protein
LQIRTPAPLLINCGYARVTIRETANDATTDSQLAFHRQFSECSQYGVTDELFSARGKNKSKFEYARSIILKAFTKKWHPTEAKSTYIAKFSSSNWKSLAKSEKQKHTLSCCNQCREEHYHLQQVFPAQPVFHNPSPAVVSLSCAPTSEKELTTSVLKDLNGTYIQQFGHTFVHSVAQNCKDVELKKTKTEKKREQRNVLRKCRDQVNEQMAQTAALTTLAEDESLSRYQRKRLSQSFEKPPAPKKLRTHSPSINNITMDKENVLNDLRDFPPATKINWSEFARTHGVNNKNGGQIIKQYATEQGVDVLKLECRTTTPTRRIRSQKRKLPGTGLLYNVMYLPLPLP